MTSDMWSSALPLGHVGFPQGIDYKIPRFSRDTKLNSLITVSRKLHCGNERSLRLVGDQIKSPNNIIK